jgi:hypothetical protein
MKNLKKQEQDYILRHINYDLKNARIEQEGWEKSLRTTTDGQYKKLLKTWITEGQNKIEFLTNLLIKTL